MLIRLGYGRLSCACNNRPYIVPIYFYFAYDADRLYCFSTLGRKIEWMRENPLVCVEADEIHGHDDWASVIVLGQYVGIPNTREYAKSREHVRSLLQKRALWWQSGYTASQIRRKTKPRSQCSTASRLRKWAVCVARRISGRHGKLERGFHTTEGSYLRVFARFSPPSQL
jgi:nitroimidazol reductase NimA-like FMN-containing flavoprotein (pyridoxamine 5'-phosphate oxidase superfamily)